MDSGRTSTGWWFWVHKMRRLCPILFLCAAYAHSGEAGPSRVASSVDPAFEYLGLWTQQEGRAMSIYAGSQVRFCLRGTGRLMLVSGLDGTIRTGIRRDGEPVWDAVLSGSHGIAVDGGEHGAEFSLVYLSSTARGFYPQKEGAKGAELSFSGLELGEKSQLSAPAKKRSLCIMDFIGDSITAGCAISGADGDPLQDANAADTFGFKLSELLGAAGRMFAHPGGTCDEVRECYPLFRFGLPVDTNATPRVVIVNVGANDRFLKETRYVMSVRQLVDRVRSYYPDTVVVLLNFFRMTPDRLPALQRIAGSYPDGDVTCFDARPYLVDYSDQGVHPGTESHSRLAEALTEFIRSERLIDTPAAHPAEK